MTFYDANGRNNHKWQYMSLSNSLKLQIFKQRIFFLILHNKKFGL